MRSKAQAASRLPMTSSPTPALAGLLQRKCACGQHTGGGECEECRQKSQASLASGGSLQRAAVNREPVNEVPPIVHDVLRAAGQPLDAQTRAFFEPRFGHDFSRVRAHTRMMLASERMEQGADAYHAYSGKSDCSPTWYGDTSPEVDPSGGSFTGKLVVKYNDAELKDPCVRECIELHESVHVKDLTPVVKKIHDCDVAAGGDWNKKGKCNQMATQDLMAARERSECAAYQKSFTCLALKILDSASPCSKSPHRDEVQKHRASEGCELKKHCAGAGTPEAGIPSV